MIKWNSVLFKTYEIGSVIFLIVVACFSMLALYSKHSQDSPFHLFSVVSGSMTPELPIGAGVVVIKQSQYFVNDIVTYVRGDQKVTHRVVFAGDYYLTKGDANKDIDQQTIMQDQIIGRVAYSFPFIGIVQQSTKSLGGLIGFVLIPSLLIVVHEAVVIIREFQKLQFAFIRRKLLVGIGVGIGVGMTFIASMLATQVSAYYTDTKENLSISISTASFGTSPSPSATPTASPSALPSVLCVNQGNGAGSVNVCINNTVNTTIVNQVNNTTVTNNINVNSNTGNNTINNTNTGLNNSSATVLTIQVTNTINSNSTSQ